MKAEAVLRKVRGEIDGDHILVAGGGPGPVAADAPASQGGPGPHSSLDASHAPTRAELRLSLGDVELF